MKLSDPKTIFWECLLTNFQLDKYNQGELIEIMVEDEKVLITMPDGSTYKTGVFLCTKSVRCET